MSDPPQNDLLATVPPPPAYYKYFTDENVARKKEAGKGPVEFPLTLLDPPPPPEAPGTYRSFGNVWQTDNKLMSLKEVGISQLYADNDDGSNNNNDQGKTDSLAQDTAGAVPRRAQELKKLIATLLVKFVELAGVMSVQPEGFPGLVEEMRVVLINVHHLLNEYRPHQSRESLLQLLEEQIAAKREEIGKLRESNDEIRDRIASLSTRFRRLLAENPKKEELGDAEEMGRPKQQLPEEMAGNNGGVVTAGGGGGHKHKALSARTLDQLSWSLLDYARPA